MLQHSVESTVSVESSATSLLIGMDDIPEGTDGMVDSDSAAYLDALYGADDSLAGSEDIASYLAELLDDSTEQGMQVAVGRPMVQPEETQEPAQEETEQSIIVCTNAQEGDLPRTVVLSRNIGFCEGIPVRKVSCLSSQVHEQRKKYYAQDCFAVSQERIANMLDVAQAPVAAVQPIPETPCSQLFWQTNSTLDSFLAAQQEPVAEPTVPAQEPAPVQDTTALNVAGKVEVLNATDETLAVWSEVQAQEQEASNLEAQLAAMQKQMADFAAMVEAKKAAAAELKANAPTPITPELRVKMDMILAIVGRGEDSLAKALDNGLVTVILPSDAKPKASSRKLVTVTHHSASNGTTEHTAAPTTVAERGLTDEQVREVRKLIELGFKDTEVAKILERKGTPLKDSLKKAASAIWNIRKGHQYTDVV